MDGESVVFQSLVMFIFAASRRWTITTRILGENFSIPRCNNASEGSGVVGTCDMMQIMANICFQNELRDLQNHRTCAMVPALTHDLQQVGG